MPIIQVGGVHGVGKSTRIEAASLLTSKEVPVIKGSIIMARILGISTEELPRQSEVDRQYARELMYREIADRKNGVRDGHYCVYSETGFEFTHNPLDIGVVAVAVLLTASPETILGRRNLIDRDRPKDLGHITEHLQLEHLGAEHAAGLLGVPLIVIRNEEQDAAIEELATVFDYYLEPTSV